MTQNNDVLHLTLDDLVNASQGDKNWVIALLEEGVIYPEQGISADTVYFNSVQLTRVRRAARLRRDFDASPQAIALILDLLEELRPLRQLQRQVRVLQRIEDIDPQ